MVFLAPILPRASGVHIVGIDATHTVRLAGSLMMNEVVPKPELTPLYSCFSGYQSVVSFFPHYNFSLAVATNIETDYQTQPAEGLCKAFNYIRALYKHTPAPVCRFVGKSSYYKSHCNCTIP